MYPWVSPFLFPFVTMWLGFAWLIRRQAKQKRLKGLCIMLWIVLISGTVFLFFDVALGYWNGVRLRCIRDEIVGIEAFEDVGFHQKTSRLIFVTGTVSTEEDADALKAVVGRHINIGCIVSYAPLVVKERLQQKETGIEQSTAADTASGTAE